jgi:hypothetical protein
VQPAQFHERPRLGLSAQPQVEYEESSLSLGELDLGLGPSSEFKLSLQGEGQGPAGVLDLLFLVATYPSLPTKLLHPTCVAWPRDKADEGQRTKGG